MAATQEIEHVSRLLEQATTRLGDDILTGKPVLVGRINEGINLVYGVFPYHSRGVGVPGRPLTYRLTRQPILAVKEGDRVTPLAYAEDVVAHPLRGILVEHLEALSPRLS